MSIENTNEEEVLDEQDETEVEEAGDKPEEGQEPKPDKNTEPDKPENPADHNRKGYEIRKGKEKAVSREEFDKVQKSVEQITEENTDLKFLKAHPELEGEAFNSLKALSKGSGKSYEECLKDPVIQNYLETNKSKSRVGSATVEPSTRTSPTNGNDYANMPLADIAKKAEEVRGRL